MTDLNKLIDPTKLIEGLMAETPEETAQRRKDNAERREAEMSGEQQGYQDSGMRPSDFY